MVPRIKLRHFQPAHAGRCQVQASAVATVLAAARQGKLPTRDTVYHRPMYHLNFEVYTVKGRWKLLSNRWRYLFPEIKNNSSTYCSENVMMLNEISIKTPLALGKFAVVSNVDSHLSK